MKNVLIIYTDQLRRDVLGCYGGREVATPHIDAIAKEGLLLDEFYTPSAVCTPSRGCFMTGRYPYRNGAYRNGIPVKEDQHGFAEAFAKAGYKTGYTGKWHLAGKKVMGEAFGPYNRLGFETWKYPMEFGHCKRIHEEGTTLSLTKDVGDGGSYTTDWLSDEVIRRIEEREPGKPFLHMVSLPDPHQPYRVRKPYDTMFDPLLMTVPESFYEKELPDWAEFDGWGRNHYFPLGLFNREDSFKCMKAIYLGMVKCIDDNVGKITNYLKKAGLWEETIVVFTTDHGEYLGEHGLMEKNNLYESVYHLPMVISMPGMACRQSEKEAACRQSGKEAACEVAAKCETGAIWGTDAYHRNQTYLSVVDFAKTLAGLAGISYPFETDGIDRSDSLLGGIEKGQREIYIHPAGNIRAGILTEQYELAYVGGDYHGHILFDRANDPQQVNNLYGDPALDAVVKELTDKIRIHHGKYGTPKEVLPKEVW